MMKVCGIPCFFLAEDVFVQEGTSSPCALSAGMMLKRERATQNKGGWLIQDKSFNIQVHLVYLFLAGIDLERQPSQKD